MRQSGDSKRCRLRIDAERKRTERKDRKEFIEEVKRHPRKFWRHVDKSAGVSECWPWLEEYDLDRYGIWNTAAGRFDAYRVAWLIGGRPIPRKAILEHYCISNSCCNPRHLYLRGSLSPKIAKSWGFRDSRARRYTHKISPSADPWERVWRVEPQYRHFRTKAQYDSMFVDEDIGPSEIEHYCGRCRTVRRMVDPEEVKTRNGRQQLRGRCEHCGAMMCKNVEPVLTLQEWAARRTQKIS